MPIRHYLSDKAFDPENHPGDVGAAESPTNRRAFRIAFVRLVLPNHASARNASSVFLVHLCESAGSGLLSVLSACDLRRLLKVRDPNVNAALDAGGTGAMTRAVEPEN